MMMQPINFGIEQFKPDRTVIKDRARQEKWLRTNSLVGTANGKDGISGLPVDGFGATRDEILKWCDFVFPEILQIVNTISRSQSKHTS